jgi:integrase
MARRRG